MWKRLGMVALAVASILGGVVKAEAATTSHKPHASYNARVLAGTRQYLPCLEMRLTHSGRVMFADMLSDTWDDGGKRTVGQQVKYVRQGCRSATEGAAYKELNKRIERMRIDAFNDGFATGACHKGEDGYGRSCR
ncbi:hypothetical protein ACIRLA_28730 [Streptomyces sp. NPDC102364]|uniref:hypothetical protein n=1 Tax=Streptomyces sp. NPDC102364 TaxID=3366161 RepID=UPI0038278413